MSYAEGDCIFHELAEKELKKVQYLILRDTSLLIAFVFQLTTHAVHELLASLLAVYSNNFELLGQLFCDRIRKRLVLSLEDSFLKFNRVLHVHYDCLGILCILEGFVSLPEVPLLGDLRVDHKHLVVIHLDKLS